MIHVRITRCQKAQELVKDLASLEVTADVTDGTTYAARKQFLGSTILGQLANEIPQAANRVVGLLGHASIIGACDVAGELLAPVSDQQKLQRQPSIQSPIPNRRPHL
jgi:hypothetical protein